MHTVNPFGEQPPSGVIDRLIGRSYKVVKTVYLNLPILKELHDSPALDLIIENMDQIRILNENVENIKNISENLTQVLEVPSWVDKVHEEGNTQIKAIKEIAEESTNQAVSTIDSLLLSSLAQIKEATGKAMFSYRYCSKALVSLQTVDISFITPSSELKVGDHLVTPVGDIFQVTEVTNTTCTVGVFVTSIKGPKGDTGLPGTGLELQGVYPSVEEFLAAGLIGKEGDAYQIYDPETDEQTVMIWNPNTQTWQNAGAIKGAQGDPGPSANEILMDPDPAKYFEEIYGSIDLVTGDIIVDVSGNDPDPSEEFGSELVYPETDDSDTGEAEDKYVDEFEDALG